MSRSATVSKLEPQKAADRRGRFSAKDRIEQARTPEIVIALCGPLGTPLHRVAEVLQQLLTEVHHYRKAEVIRLSAFIRQYGSPANPDSVSDLIAAGNKLRDQHGLSVLTQLAIQKIVTERAAIAQGKTVTPQLPLEGLDEGLEDEGAVAPAPTLRHCHIIDSIKNKDELHLLRSVYGEMLHVISVYTPIDLRARELEKKFGSRAEVYAFIDKDSGEEIESGQSVRDIFPLADYFLRVDGGTDDQIKKHLERYLSLLLGTAVITPTASERAMYAAFAASRNSGCLSRQVGAAIADENGDVLAVGWNDVPKAFGGLYEHEPAQPTGRPYIDHRCWNKDGGKCHNDEEKQLIASKLADALVSEEIIEAADRSKVEARLRKSSELKGLIEFSRAVHAEMHALLNAGRSNGSRIRGGSLFVTTYPCHSCARHIIASGIKEVRFIEPYRKSLATRLHEDAITEIESDTTKVRIVPFDGVAPGRYLSLFSAVDSGRKDAGTGKMTRRGTTIPVTAVTLEAIPTLEVLAIKELESCGLLQSHKPAGQKGE